MAIASIRIVRLDKRCNVIVVRRAFGVRRTAHRGSALTLATPIGIESIARSIGVLQASMPAAVLDSIIAVLFSTPASVVTLSVVLALV